MTVLDDLGEERPTFEITPLSWDYGLAVAGELDHLTSSELASALRDLDRDEEIVLDLAEVTFIDSMGMHALLSYARSFDPSRPLVIAKPSPTVLRLLELACVKDMPSLRIRTGDAAETPASLAEHVHELARRASLPTLDPDPAA